MCASSALSGRAEGPRPFLLGLYLLFLIISAALSEPIFVGTLRNVSTVVGSNVVFHCKVQNLGDYEVSWLHRVEGGALSILSSGERVLANAEKVKVTRSDVLWSLHIHDVTTRDSGAYLCQINTYPDIRQVAFLHVVYPKIQLRTLKSLQPKFLDDIPNATVAIGRDAVLQCTVENLGHYKVAWIKKDTETLLTIDKRVISHTKKMRVTNNNLQWNLHIGTVDEKDKGIYMCQINTEPMISQEGYLDVMVPPSILESGTSSDTVAEERSKVSLRCEATGYPEPLITWRREDGKDINLGSYGGRKYSALRVEGEFLNISQVSREDMGAYLCIASNGVLPSVSKRIILQVNFRPKIRVPNQLVGAASGSDVVLECRLEASPVPLTSWIRSDGIMLLDNRKYEIQERREGYKLDMKIKIFSLTDKDFGSYKCVAKNTLGEKEGFIRLYEIPPATVNPKDRYEVYLPRLREHLQQNGSLSMRKNVPSNTLMDESEFLSGASLQSSGHIQRLVLSEIFCTFIVLCL